MTAVILAAGFGGRLRPLTDHLPKCMVPVCGTRVIDRQIANLLGAGIDGIHVVAGYKADVLERHLAENWPSVGVVANPRYSGTNNMYSLSLARDRVAGGDFVLMNGDVFFEPGILDGLVKAGGGSLIACDRGLYREESMKIAFDGTKITHIGKEIPESGSYAVSIDVYRISARDGELLFDEIADTIGRGNETAWTEVALDRIFGRTVFRPFEISGRWVEIDTCDDLRRAEALFGPGETAGAPD